tara:strand:+ start:676 stop:1485 length:810 start_codon:yes stop_codon:yes gene_type:complete
MDNPGARVYNQGDLIAVNRDSLVEVILSCAQALGFDSFYPEFEIEENSDEYHKQTGRRALYTPSDNRFLLFPEEHEGIIYHESVHYVMHHMDLLMGRVDGEPLFYGDLLDETIAELCTGRMHGYKPIVRAEIGVHGIGRFWEYFAIFGVVHEGKKVIYPEEDWSKRGATPPEEVYWKQRRIEDRYRETKSLIEIEDDVQELLGYFPAKQHEDLRERKFAEGIGSLAIENSHKLNMNEVLPWQLKDIFQEGKDTGISPQRLYFERVLSLI